MNRPVVDVAHAMESMLAGHVGAPESCSWLLSADSLVAPSVNSQESVASSIDAGVLTAFYVGDAWGCSARMRASKKGLYSALP